MYMIDRIAINPQYLNNSEDECDIQEMHTTKSQNYINR